MNSVASMGGRDPIGACPNGEHDGKLEMSPKETTTPQGLAPAVSAMD
jgi:hypothetical protein